MPALGNPAARWGGIPAAAAAMATDWLTVGGGGGGAGPASPADIMGCPPRSPRHLLGGGGPDGGGGCGGATEDLDQGTSILVLGRAIWGEKVRT